MRRPWPSKRERKGAVEVAERQYEQTVHEGRAFKESVDRLRQLRQSNGFKERFEAALKGSS